MKAPIVFEVGDNASSKAAHKYLRNHGAYKKSAAHRHERRKVREALRGGDGSDFR
jgi:hypothetical protein